MLWRIGGHHACQIEPASLSAAQTVIKRDGVKAGMKVGEEYRSNRLSEDSKEAEKARAILFGQRDRNPERR